MSQRDKSILSNVRSMVTDMLQKVQKSSYVVDLSFDVEELYSMLDLDIMFDKNECKELKKYGYKIIRGGAFAEKKFNKYFISATKDGVEDYSITIDSDGLSTPFCIDDLSELKTTNKYFKSMLQKHKDNK